MKYRKFIEDNFWIDAADTGELVPFKFNKVQNKYYDELSKDYDIEKKGVQSAVRDIILKARREGFSSLILAIFAADDILQEHPTETLVVSYKDDATKVFRRRYKNYILSYFAKKMGLESVNQITPEHERFIFSEKEGGNYTLRHNKAHFYCGTASGRTAERGGVNHKLLFSEAAFYPDTDILTAREIIEGTLRQVDLKSGLVFVETTANGYGNHYEKMWHRSINMESRFRPRFYGALEFYTDEELKQIESEFTDKQMYLQEYPTTPEEAFIHSGSPYFDNRKIGEYIKIAPDPEQIGRIELADDLTPKYEEDINGELKIWEFPGKNDSYVLGGDTAEGLEDGDWSVATIINNRTLKTAAKLKTHVEPGEYAKLVYAMGTWYNNAYIGIEANKDGLWVNTELFKMGYPNLYYREQIDDLANTVSRKVGFKTTEATRPFILSELRKMLKDHGDIWNNRDFLAECLTFVRKPNGRPEAMSSRHDDEIFATAIAYEIRRNAPEALAFSEDSVHNKVEEMIRSRLDELYRKKGSEIKQSDYI